MASRKKISAPGSKRPPSTNAAHNSNGVNIGEYAPPPMIDKYPRIVGSRLTLNEVSSIMKQSTFGLRKRYVDLLDELIERDPSAFACVNQRVISVASSEISVRAPKHIPKKYKKRAEKLAEWVNFKLHNIPELKAALAKLQWAMFYGLAGQEISWGTDAEGDFVPTRLNPIHSRRLEYPKDGTWDLYIKDDMPVESNWYEELMGVKAAAKKGEPWWGIRIDDFPGKFIVYAPSVRAQYPTREGLGRQLAIYMALKSMAMRSGSQTIERFAKPWAIAYYNTKTEENGSLPRVATTNGQDSDVYKAEHAMQALGTGAMTYAVLPDSVELKPQENLTGSFTAELPQTIFIKYIDQQIARAVLTTDEFTIAAGVGSQAKAEVLKRNLMQVLQYDADCLAEAIKYQLVRFMVLYNFPEDVDLLPDILIQVQDAPNLEQLVMAADCAFDKGAPIDIVALCDKFDIPLTDDVEKQAQQRIDPNEQMKVEASKEIAKDGAKAKAKAASGKKSGTQKRSPSRSGTRSGK